MSNPVVAIWMLTYNHRAFIGQAIEGVINQQTNFSFKLYLGEDCSTDGTREICESYKLKYPNVIELMLTPRNDIVQNAKNIYDACFKSGAKYVAMCEGDDYWTDPYKLQKQVDLLETNPEIILCASNAMKEREGKLTPFVTESSHFIEIETLIERNPFLTATVIFRNVIRNYSEIYKFPFGDWSLYWVLMKESDYKAKLFFIGDITTVYRQHAGSLHSSLSKQKRLEMNLRFYEQLNILTDSRFSVEIAEHVRRINDKLKIVKQGAASLSLMGRIMRKVGVYLRLMN